MRKIWLWSSGRRAVRTFLGSLSDGIKFRRTQGKEGLSWRRGVQPGAAPDQT